MQDALDAVCQFHLHVNAPVSAQPTPLSGNRAAAIALAEQLESLAKQTMTSAAADDVLLRRAAMALEELAEWLAANERADIVAAADAWADRAYVLFGDAVTAGLPAAALFAEVHQSDMTKEPDPQRTGKAVKGPSYCSPDLRKILDEAQATDQGRGPGAAKSPSGRLSKGPFAAGQNTGQGGRGASSEIPQSAGRQLFRKAPGCPTISRRSPAGCPSGGETGDPLHRPALFRNGPFGIAPPAPPELPRTVPAGVSRAVKPPRRLRSDTAKGCV